MSLTVSVVVPVRTGGAAFAACLRSLAATDPPPLEIIVADDGSEEDSAAVRAQRHAPLQQPDHARLTGMLAARNVVGARHDLWLVNTERSYHEERQLSAGAA